MGETRSATGCRARSGSSGVSSPRIATSTSTIGSLPGGLTSRHSDVTSSGTVRVQSRQAVNTSWARAPGNRSVPAWSSVTG